MLVLSSYITKTRQRFTFLLFAVVVAFHITLAWSDVGSLEKKVIARSHLSWSKSELNTLQSLSLANLELPPPLNPSNKIADNPFAQQLGKKLFFDNRLSSTGKISCSSCHVPELNFTDGQKVGSGVESLSINVPTILGVAYNSWFFFDGRKDSLWSQALTPLESPAEMGLTRIEVVNLVTSDLEYKTQYSKVFGEPNTFEFSLPNKGGPYGDSLGQKQWKYLPHSSKVVVNQIFANIGRALAAYQRTILPDRGRLEAFILQLDSSNEGGTSRVLTHSEEAGLKLFIDTSRTQCLNCHNGPLLTNGSFHNIGTGETTGKQLNLGRLIGIQAVLADEFNCFGVYSGVNKGECDSLRFLNAEDTHSPLLGAYKVPTLRGISKTAPYGHDGRFESLELVMKHYVNPPSTDVTPHELQSLDLTSKEIQQIVDFLKVL